METNCIPVSERLPEVEQLVVFTTGDDYHMGFFTKYGDWYSGTSNRCFDKDDVVAFVALPEPYRKDGENG